jgi:hypothetical protein
VTATVKAKLAQHLAETSSQRMVCPSCGEPLPDSWRTDDVTSVSDDNDDDVNERDDDTDDDSEDDDEINEYDNRSTRLAKLARSLVAAANRRITNNFQPSAHDVAGEPRIG